MRKGTTGVLVSLLLLALLLAAGPAAAQQTVRLTFWTFVDAHADYYLARAEEFNAQNPGVRLELEAVSLPYREMHDQLLISLQTGIGAPDIVDIEITPFARFLREPIQLLQLDRIIEPHQASIIENRLTPYSKDGHVYGVPTHLGAFVTFYNREFFNDRGIDIESIKLWDDFVAVGSRVTRDVNNDGVVDEWMTMLDGPGWFQWFGMIQQQGSGHFDAQGNPILNSEVNIRTLEYLHDMVYKHRIALAGIGLHDLQAYDMINAGQVGAVWMPQWYSIRYTEFMPDLHGKMVMRPLPAWEPGGSRSAMGGGTGTAITNQINPAHVDIAMQFLEFAKLTYDANVKIWTEFGFDPFRYDVFDDPQLQQPIPYFSNEVVFNVIKDIADEINPQYLSPVFQETNWEVLDPEIFFPVITENSISPRDALNAAQERVLDLLRNLF